jgi:hypothetical protein
MFLNSIEEMLVELLKREKEAGIKPDPDADIFMKVNSTPSTLHAMMKLSE